MTDPTDPGPEAAATEAVDADAHADHGADDAARRKKLWIAAGALAAVLAILTALLISTLGDDDDQVATTDETSTTAEATTTAATTTTTGASSTTAEATTSAPATTTTGAPTTTVAPLEGASTDPRSGDGHGTAPALMSQLRVSCNAGSDRVVFEFLDGALPGWEVRYVPGPITMDGSGDEVAVAGGAYLSVRMFPAAGHDLSQPTFPATYTGPNRVAANCPSTTEVVENGEFEAVYNWTIGVESTRGFVVTTLDSPSRLVVDVAHG